MKIHFTTIVWHGNFHGFVIRAFESLGHEVIFFDQGGSGVEKNIQKIAARLPKVERTADWKFRERISKRWLDSIAATKPDLVLLMDYATNITPQAILEARRRGFTVFHWVSSPPLEGGAKDLLASIRFSTKAFFIDRLWVPIVFDKDEYVHLPLAGDEKIFHPGNVGGSVAQDGNKKYDVLFVGSFNPNWDGFIRAQVLSKAAEKFKVAAFGRGARYWLKYFPTLESSIVRHDVLDAEELNEAYHQAKIVLNLHSVSHKASISARTYEVALAGAFQIVDHREDLDVLFPKDHFVSFKSASEVNGLIETWLAKPEEREARAQKIREYVLAQHTWTNRAREILNYVK